MNRAEEEAAAFPSYEVYAWHHPCLYCSAGPGEPCAAPRQWAGHRRRNELLAKMGRPQVEAPEYGFMHSRRVDAGGRHRQRDIAKAPWREDREPGRTYDTLPRPLLPPVAGTTGERQG